MSQIDLIAELAGEAAAIKQQLNVEATLIPGGGGSFDVVVDGRRIYCKPETGRFPTHDEVLAKFA